MVLLCKSKETIVKTKFTDYIYFDDQDIYYLHNKKLFETGLMQSTELRMIKNNIPFCVLIESILKYDKSQQTSWIVIKDITERKKAEAELLKAKKEAESANKAKSSFLANMSHELRTPMNGIIGFINILIEEEKDTDKKECLETIAQSANNLLILLNDILNLSKIESGKTELHKKTINLHEFTNNTHKLFNQQAKHKCLNFTIELNNNLPEIIIADETAIMQILNNLIGNSIKFTRAGYINLAVKQSFLKSGVECIEFSVTDTGIGINEEKQKRLYEPFEQGEYYLTKKYGGTGLGLTIVKQLVDLMSGEIEVHTEIGKGTKFIIKIPFESFEKIQIQPEIKKEKTEFKKNLKILLAEDDEISAKLLKFIAKKENWNLKTVANGKELLEELEKDNYDLVLMDIQMPIMDGLEATKIIRQNKKYDGLTIIAISAFAMAEEIVKAIKTGVNGYVVKPLTADSLKEVMHEKMDDILC